MKSIEAPDSTIVGVTFIKCQPGMAKAFQSAMLEHFFDKKTNWSPKFQGIKVGSVECLLLISTAGYFDYGLISRASNTFMLSQFCLDVLRAEGSELEVETTQNQANRLKDMGCTSESPYSKIAECVYDVQTAIGLTILANNMKWAGESVQSRINMNLKKSGS